MALELTGRPLAPAAGMSAPAQPEDDKPEDETPEDDAENEEEKEADDE